MTKTFKKCSFDGHNFNFHVDNIMNINKRQAYYKTCNFDTYLVARRMHREYFCWHCCGSTAPLHFCTKISKNAKFDRL